MATQGVAGAHPHRFELFFVVSHRRLTLGHAGHQKRHVKAARQVAVGDPMGQQKHLVSGQGEAALLTLGCKVCCGGVAVQCGDVKVVGHAAIGMARQQDAQFFKAFANGRHGLGQQTIALRAATRGQGVGLGIGGVDAATRKHIGTRCKTGGHGAPRHEHFQALRAVAQQQHGGRGSQGSAVALGVEELGRSDHGRIMRSRSLVFSPSVLAAGLGPCG